MSLLGTPVYANPSTPFWMGVGGGTVSGNLTVNGNLAVSGNADFTGTLVRIRANDKLYFTSANGATTGLLEYTDNGTNGFIETNGNLYLGRTLAGNTANTVFTPSAATTNNDVLAVGGTVSTKAGASITPQTIATNKSVAPIPASPIVTNIANDTAYPTVNGAVYDVSIKGRVLIAGGVADPDDQVQVVINNLQNYPGMSWIYVVYPSATGSVGLFDIRTRIISDAAIASLTVGFSTILNGASTAVYDGSVFSFNATRVA